MTPPDLFDLPATWTAGEWGKYEDLLYEVFLRTLVRANLSFRGLPVSIKRLPTYKGKHFAFWHLISEGEKEEERTPDLQRCRCLPLIAWVISVCDQAPEISIFENERRGETNTVLWYETSDYAVILSKRNGYFLLKTAYPLNPDRKVSFQRDKDEFIARSRS